MPYQNLNTAAFDGKGRIWFTGQNGLYGRLDPTTGEMKVWDAPKGRGPYGITGTPSGDIWFVSLAGSYLAHFDLETGAATVCEPPTENRSARRVWFSSKDLALRPSRQGAVPATPRLTVRRGDRRYPSLGPTEDPNPMTPRLSSR
jgi:streptogramin lyase